MSCSTYYVQECPICGRTLQVRVEYLGKKVSCQHCAASFRAADPSLEEPETTESSTTLLARAEKLILESDCVGASCSVLDRKPV